MANKADEVRHWERQVRDAEYDYRKAEQALKDAKDELWKAERLPDDEK